MTLKSDYHECPACHARLILAKGFPGLNYWPDQFGVVAAQHTASGAWVARGLSPGDEPVVPEKRYAVHSCDEAGPGLPGDSP